jgi:hypothetical protein
METESKKPVLPRGCSLASLSLLVVTGFHGIGSWITKDTVGTGYSIGKAPIEVHSVGTIGHFTLASKRAGAAFDGTFVPRCCTGGWCNQIAGFDGPIEWITKGHSGTGYSIDLSGILIGALRAECHGHCPEKRASRGLGSTEGPDTRRWRSCLSIASFMRSIERIAKDGLGTGSSVALGGIVK